MRRLWNSIIILGMTIFSSILVAAQSNETSKEFTFFQNNLTVYLYILTALLLAGWVMTAIIQYLAWQRQKEQLQTVQTALQTEMEKRENAQHNILEISEREQLRIGHELHDGVVHDLTALGLAGDLLLKEMGLETPELMDKLNGFIRVVDQSAAKLRDLAKGLSPVNLDEVGLNGAVEQFAKQTANLSGISCTCECSGKLNIQNHETALHLYRMVQEAVNNAVKHSHAQSICIRICEEEKKVHVSVEDDGIGFDPSENGHEGMGIYIMKYRADITGADFQIQSKPNHGTSVLFTIPEAAVI